MTDKKSFDELPTWLDEAKRHGVTSSNSTLVVIGNKIDQYPREVAESKVSSYRDIDMQMMCRCSTIEYTILLSNLIILRIATGHGICSRKQRIILRNERQNRCLCR